MSNAKTLYDKLWDMHVVKQRDDGNTLLYIDRYYMHEISSPVAFSSMRESSRPFWRTTAGLGIADHQTPTENHHLGWSGIDDDIARIQVKTLDENCEEYGFANFRLEDKRQGIIHVVGPEQGLSLPGMTIVCGDSHTSTHGALAALAQGIGTSELEHVMATQTLLQQKCKNMRVDINGQLPVGVTAKDLSLYLIAKIGTAGGTGYAIEYTGTTVSSLSMEQRFTLCNMTIEAGARTGLIAYDKITETYIKDRPHTPKGDAWLKANDYWHEYLRSGDEAVFDTIIEINAADVVPHITWGTKPDQAIPITENIPLLSQAKDELQRKEWQSALDYMGLDAGANMKELSVDQVFIGSCTNSRIEDLRTAAAIVRGKKVAASVKRAMIVPGSGLVKEQAEEEGLDAIFIAAGFEWREAGCSMCNAMNADSLGEYERCASTSNRNFEGRQGYKGRTHLVSPAMAAATAINGHFVDVRHF